MKALKEIDNHIDMKLCTRMCDAVVVRREFPTANKTNDFFKTIVYLFLYKLLIHTIRYVPFGKIVVRKINSVSSCCTYLLWFHILLHSFPFDLRNI